MASVANDLRAAPEGRRFQLKRSAPVLVLGAVLLLLPLAVLTTLHQPMGAMMWDLYIYLDATNRIAGGQIPSIDFFAPVGALGYYLFAGASWLFPNGHPLFLSAWSLLVVTAPLMAMVLIDVQRRSTALAFALLAPFLLYSLLPFNIGNFYPYPGSEGFGIYNRQVCQLLYVLAAALVFIKDGRKLCGVVAASMLALFFIKITGVVAGALMCGMALAAGRLSLRRSVIAASIFAAILVGLELATGVVSAYIGDILALLLLNDETLLPRLLKAASMNIGVSLATAGLCLALVLTDLDLVRQRFAHRGVCSFAEDRLGNPRSSLRLDFRVPSRGPVLRKPEYRQPGSDLPLPAAARHGPRSSPPPRQHGALRCRRGARSRGRHSPGGRRRPEGQSRLGGHAGNGAPRSPRT